MMQIEKIRIAMLKGYVIKKRCRKEEFKIIEAIGDDDNSAVSGLILKFYSELDSLKTFNFDKLMIYDATRVIRKDYNMIERPLFPGASENLVVKDFFYDKDTKVAFTK